VCTLCNNDDERVVANVRQFLHFANLTPTNILLDGNESKLMVLCILIMFVCCNTFIVIVIIIMVDCSVTECDKVCTSIMNVPEAMDYLQRDYIVANRLNTTIEDVMHTVKEFL
jgi:hypothetical protein